MVAVGDGVWISFKYDATLRLFHGTTLSCMQDLDIAPSVNRILGSHLEPRQTLIQCVCAYALQRVLYLFVSSAFGNERHMPIQVSTLIPAHNALWVGTENGVLVSFPFTLPTMVAEESGWELIKASLHVSHFHPL